jgi:hypothetical protein
VTVKGRYWVMLWLALFLGVAAIVTARQTAAIKTAGRLEKLRDEHRSLQARRAELERRIHQAESRQVLGRKAVDSLGLHQASDSELVEFTVPADDFAEARR